MLALLSACILAVAGVAPAPASAHGPVAPVALDYLARITRVPPGLDAKVVDGDQRMWLRVSPAETVVVLDYRGAPYLRFTRSGVDVNRSSAMYFLNQTPFAQTPPPGLGPGTPPRWERVSSGHEYGWHDGRLHALAAVALTPGSSFVGTWRVPIRVDGRPGAISGSLWHAYAPSLVWFWPIVVVLLCVLAAWRVRRPAVDRRTAQVLALGGAGATAVGSIGQGLHGRPGVSAFQLGELGLVLAFVLWGLARVLTRRSGFFTYLVLGLIALWEGLELVPTLYNGFVLIALPAFVARAASVTALGAGAGLLLILFRLLPSHEERAVEDLSAEEAEEEAWELT